MHGTNPNRVEQLFAWEHPILLFWKHKNTRMGTSLSSSEPAVWKDVTFRHGARKKCDHRHASP